jgi:isovaleryl-CoA dehydrogenase
VRDFCAKECGTRAQRDDLTEGGTEGHSQQLYDQLARLGWLGVSIPEEYGGSGGGITDQCVFIENAWHGLAPIYGYGTSIIVAGPYEKFGTEEQKHRVLSGIAGGVVQSIAMSEPGAGSDVASLACRARRDGHEWVINGQKTWISNIHNAANVLTVVRTASGAKKHDGLTMLEVPVDTPGLEMNRIETMGGREVSDVFYTDCRVPAENVLGQEGAAWRQLMASLNSERLIIAAQALGVVERVLDDVLVYVRERQQFGRPIGTFQALKHRIADLATEVECCRLLVYAVAAEVDRDPAKLRPREASMAKLKCTEVLKAVALEGMQMMGAYGYATEYEMEHHVRRALVTTIYGGTSEIQREIIGGTYGL